MMKLGRERGEGGGAAVGHHKTTRAPTTVNCAAIKLMNRNDLPGL